MNNKFEDIVAEEEQEGLLSESSYGSPDDLLAKKSVEDHLNYENQIGEFDITPDLKKMSGDNFKVNMGQSSEKIGASPSRNSTNDVVKMQIMYQVKKEKDLPILVKKENLLFFVMI